MEEWQDEGSQGEAARMLLSVCLYLLPTTPEPPHIHTVCIHLLSVLFPILPTSVNNKSPTDIITITELQLTFITTWDSSF